KFFAGPSVLYFPKLSKFPKKQKRKNCKLENHSLRRAWKGDNVCLQLGKWGRVYVLHGVPGRHAFQAVFIHAPSLPAQ
ncbi:MAG: hypothetical protein ACOCNQ_04780, partial [Bacteroidales bacterium]